MFKTVGQNDRGLRDPPPDVRVRIAESLTAWDGPQFPQGFVHDLPGKDLGVLFEHVLVVAPVPPEKDVRDRDHGVEGQRQVDADETLRGPLLVPDAWL